MKKHSNRGLLKTNVKPAGYFGLKPLIASYRGKSIAITFHWSPGKVTRVHAISPHPAGMMTRKDLFLWADDQVTLFFIRIYFTRGYSSEIWVGGGGGGVWPRAVNPCPISELIQTFSPIPPKVFSLLVSYYIFLDFKL